jgi:hypothetical protein
MLDFSNDDARKLYNKLLASAHDLAFARYCADVLLKKGWHSAPWERRGTVYHQQAAFTTALVVSYCRPFTRSKGWPKLPTDLIHYNEQEMTFHESVLRLRHRVYAHSDSSSYNFRPFRLTDHIVTDVETRAMFRLSKGDTEVVVALTTKMLGAIYNEISFMRRDLGDAS